MNWKDEQPTTGEEDIVKRLERHPAVKARVLRLLDLADNAGGGLNRADDAERRAIDELRIMGQELLCDWGQQRADENARQVEMGGDAIRQVKKTLLA